MAHSAFLAPEYTENWKLFILFTKAYGRALVTTGDNEFFSPDYFFSMADFVDIAACLRVSLEKGVFVLMSLARISLTILLEHRILRVLELGHQGKDLGNRILLSDLCNAILQVLQQFRSRK